ncbi:MAG: hypothetical protein CO092_05615 [Candidatus Aenigmarchaeota archaeon CG_4_9_14_3_um_filter_37_18]|nr:MAG: hypothetical protein AUJ50_05160 [Candidatus Aenigmarchaeota archaeon CG1_02_38_14]PJB74002.1 MAG: hypothetical protein CO092_05615 [Candidatus Aenigmarchaeota archaeon CG_4_9_14_3_um_filter_37_18]
MEIEISKKTIKLEKELNLVDEFVIDVSKILGEYFNYVIVSGYLPILFGKVRGTEDVDVFIEEVSLEKFKEFCEELDRRGYEILNSKDAEDAYDILKERLAIRLSKEGEFIPNFELKFPEDVWGTRSIKERIKVVLNGNEFFISSIEMNIAFKIYLGSRKDIDDACHLYLLFKKLKHLDEGEIKKICSELGVTPDILKRCKDEE